MLGEDPEGMNLAKVYLCSSNLLVSKVTEIWGFRMFVKVSFAGRNADDVGP